MTPYQLLVACSCVISAACAGFVAARASDRAVGACSAFLLLGGAVWSLSEAAASVATEPETAFVWLRGSVLGWAFVGPVVLDLVVRLYGRPTGLARLVLPAYAGGVLVSALTWLTPWVVTRPLRTTWGWSFERGPAHLAYYAVTLLCVGAAFLLLRRLFDTRLSEGERRQRPVVMAGMFVPLVAGSLTDALLPWLGFHPPRLGSSSFAVLGMLAVANISRFGYSVMSPGSFADEILDSLQDGVALLRNDGTIRLANRGLVRLTGRSASALEDSPLGDVFVPALPEPLAEFEERQAEIESLTGERIPVAIAARVVRDRPGRPVGLVVSIRDLREVESLRSGLASSARLASVGQLAAGIAHEINNPLAFVRANLNQLRSHCRAVRDGLEEGDGSAALDDRLTESEEIIEESLEGVDRAAEIVRGVKGFSHAGSATLEDADLNAVLDQVVSMATPQLRPLVSVERCFSELPRVRCAPQQLKQVFLNLIVNGAQAAGDGGRLRLTTQRELAAVRVEVADDGCGMPPEVRERIFDPFFTTKAVGEGTGLGLAIASQIVHSHGGTIEVDSEPGRGSSFRVRIPVRA